MYLRNLSVVFVTLLLFSCKQQVHQKELSIHYSVENKSVIIYTTAQNSDLRLTKTAELVFEKSGQPLENEISILVNPQKLFQTFIGIGGAITDASAEVFAKLSVDKQEEFLNAYYSEIGINYRLLRTTIHSCDFSSASYTYIEEGDSLLTTFSIEQDKEYRIPMIKRALDITGGEMIVYASPWSPPAFMKGKADMLNGGSLLPRYYQLWANYYVKFIKAYENEGIPIWGITIQNEPMATQIWESCIYTAEEERDFLKNYLGPTFEKAGLEEKNIVVWDHNRDLISHRANTIFGDPEASKYAWGIGFHWYETWSGGDPMWDNLSNIRESFPDKKLLFTEGCVEKFSEEDYQRWSNAERYGRSMINDFNCGTVGWTDWNILLDHTGGPNHVGNFCFAPVHADTRTNELIYTPAYFYIGHFSKYIKVGAKRVSTSTSRSSIRATSFLNLDGKMVTVILNDTDKNCSYKFIVEDRQITVNIPAHAIQTLVY
jgi:glucosylceramidase